MTPRVLALDTTGEFGSIALLTGTEVVEEALLHSPDGFAHVLHDQIAGLLARHDWKIGEVDLFAATSGPGSFTGVRIGLAAVKGLAAALDRPVLGISNLKAMASFGSRPLRAVMADARRGEVYGGVYDAALQPVREERVMKFADWLEILPDGDLELVATNFAPFRHILPGTRFENAPLTEAPRALAAAAGQIAIALYQAGDPGDPVVVDANYVRRSDAELFWKN